VDDVLTNDLDIRFLMSAPRISLSANRTIRVKTITSPISSTELPVTTTVVVVVVVVVTAVVVVIIFLFLYIYAFEIYKMNI